MHRQPGVFYDYGVANRPGSQFFYPTQTMMYPPSSMVTPQMQPAVPATLGDKKRELQVPLMFVYKWLPCLPSFTVQYSTADRAS